MVSGDDYLGDDGKILLYFLQLSQKLRTFYASSPNLSPILIPLEIYLIIIYSNTII
jgi:hypothetical protein